MNKLSSAQLDGKTKAAIFLLSLEEDQAVKVVEHFSEKELKALRGAVDKIGAVSADSVEKVYQEFISTFNQGGPAVSGGATYLKNLVRKARGEEEAIKLFAATQPIKPVSAEQSPLSKLAKADANALTLALGAEHPQVAAAVLAHLTPDMAAKVLEQMSAAQQTDVLRRITALTAIPQTSFADAEHGLEGLDLQVGDAGEMDGIQSAAGILNAMADREASDLVERLAEYHPDAASSLRRAMFTFENLVEADKRGLQQMLREVPSDTLLISLKMASDPLKDKLLSCMSSRAAQMLLEELEMMGPVRVTEVETAQQQIVELATRLIGEGKLTISGRGENMV